MPKTVESIPARLRRLRGAVGMSQAKLALAAGVDREVVARVEQGRRDLRKADAGTVLALARALGVSVEVLLG